MAVPKITLYVDTASPFAYLAYYILRHDPVFKGCDIKYVPVLLGGIIKACGNTPPMRIKNKDKWVARERIWWARAFDVPMPEEMPPSFPPMTLSIMRALCVIAKDREDGGWRSKDENLTSSGDANSKSCSGKATTTLLLDALDAFFAEYWVNHVPTYEPAELRRVLRRLLGDEGAENVILRAGTEGKQLLLQNTDKAINDGAFGLPWFVCTNASGQTEGFWGVDHLGQVTQFLGLERPKNSVGWTSVL